MKSTPTYSWSFGRMGNQRRCEVATDLKHGALNPPGGYRKSLGISLLIKVMRREGFTIIHDRKSRTC